MRVFLVGEQYAAAQTLEALLGTDGVTVVGVACDEAAGSQQLVRRVYQLALPVVPSRRLNDAEVLKQVRRTSPDLAVNVNSLVVFESNLLQLFAYGAVNFHPGPLPEYAGLNVHQWAIINGEAAHAVTFHRMEERIDAGDVLIQAAVAIEPTDTGLKLFMRCIQTGVNLIRPLMTALINGEIRPQPQNLTRRQYFGRGPYDWEISFDQPATRLVNLVRALDYRPFESPLGTPRLRLNGRPYTVREARRAAGRGTVRRGEICGWTEQREPIFMCGDGAGLVMPSLFDGNRRVAWEEVLTGDAARMAQR